MKTLINTIRRAAVRARLVIAASDLAFMEARAPLAIADQRAVVRHLAARLDLLESDMCNPCAAEPHVSSEDIRARAERRMKEALL